MRHYNLPKSRVKPVYGLPHYFNYYALKPVIMCICEFTLSLKVVQSIII